MSVRSSPFRPNALRTSAQTAAAVVSLAFLTACATDKPGPILGVAQYLAVQRAEAAIGSADAETATSSGNGIGAGGRERLETDRGAVAGASVVALSYLFPASGLTWLPSLAPTTARRLTLGSQAPASGRAGGSADPS